MVARKPVSSSTVTIELKIENHRISRCWCGDCERVRGEQWQVVEAGAGGRRAGGRGHTQNHGDARRKPAHIAEHTRMDPWPHSDTCARRHNDTLLKSTGSNA
jgi:hypothetical protein